MDKSSTLADRAIAAAETALASRFAGAEFAYVTGSIMRGEGTASSDIDLVVVFSSLQRAWRESFVCEGFPVEAFVHDPETLKYFLHRDAEGGCTIMANMVATGVIVGADGNTAKTIQAEAGRMLAAGPAPLSGQSYKTLLYRVTDLADDLRGQRPPDEVAAIAAMLYQNLADLMLLGRGAWAGRGKWTPRLLRGLDRDLAEAFERAFRSAAQGEGTHLLALADAELARHGGRFFDGYRQEAELEARQV